MSVFKVISNLINLLEPLINWITFQLELVINHTKNANNYYKNIDFA